MTAPAALPPQTLRSRAPRAGGAKCEFREVHEGPILGCALRLGVILSNPGKVVVTYEVKEIRVTFAGRTVDEPRFETRGGVIHPDNETVFWYPTIQNLALEEFPADGIVEVRLSFAAHGDKSRKPSTCVARLRYILARPPEKYSEWTYLEGPTYS